MSVLGDAPISPENNGLKEIRACAGGPLVSSDSPPFTMNMDQLDGYLHAIAAEPRATDGKYWMPLVFGGEFPCFINGHSTDNITNALICLYNSHRVQVLNQTCELASLVSTCPIKLIG